MTSPLSFLILAIRVLSLSLSLPLLLYFPFSLISLHPLFPPCCHSSFFVSSLLPFPLLFLSLSLSLSFFFLYNLIATVV